MWIEFKEIKEKFKLANLLSREFSWKIIAFNYDTEVENVLFGLTKKNRKRK